MQNNAEEVFVIDTRTRQPRLITSSLEAKYGANKLLNDFVGKSLDFGHILFENRHYSFFVNFQELHQSLRP